MTGWHASRRSAVPPFHVMRVFEAAAERREQGGVVWDLSAGQPTTPAPPAVRAAARDALDGRTLGYTSARGLLGLRRAIAEHYRQRYELDVAPGDIIVTTGSSGAFVLAFLAAFDAGDRVAVTRPGYPAYRNTLRALGCDIVDIACGPSSGFQLSLAALEQIDPPPAGVVLASPANPTGSMVKDAELAAIVAWCDERGVRLISDEIYHGIGYGPIGSCAWQTARSAVVVNSFSKYFAMTGWRLGWLLAPADLNDRLDALATNLALCAPTLSQYAAVHAFDDYAGLDAAVAGYAVSRTVLIDGLRALGIDRLAPADGAFYVYADVSDFTDDSMILCTDMLAETGVAAAPGLDFDLVDGAAYVRMSFAGGTDVVSGALEALGGWLPRRRLS